jgi:beta-lactamase superfamily II metal-dependent hydrolase
LPGDHWLLVDCHLTKSDGTYDRFFDFLKSRNIKRLQYIVLTHPDIDHFLGMVDVLRYFTSDDRSVNVWCDSGPNSQQVREALGSLSLRRYDELQQLLDELAEQKKIVFYHVDQNGNDIGPAGLENRVDLVPIAPNPGEIRRLFRRDVERLGSNPGAAVAANPLSVVLVVCVNDSGHRFQLLLGADPEADGLATALAVWERRAANQGRPRTLDAVKVPHHGSPRSHCSDLCRMGPTGTSGKVAVVSAGMRQGLPERSVLADYLSNKWTLLITTTRRVRTPRSRFSFLVSKNPSSFRAGVHDIQLSWSAVEGLRWKPSEAEVTEADLPSYHSST